MSAAITRRGLLAGAVLCAAPGASARAEDAATAAAEPSYRYHLPEDFATLPLRMRFARAPDGGSVVSLVGGPVPTRVPARRWQMRAVLSSDAAQRPTHYRCDESPRPDYEIAAEATREPDGHYAVRTPALDGEMRLGSPLYVPLFAHLFVGRMYDWKRGGEQTFALLQEADRPPLRLLTLRLTAESGTELVRLQDRSVPARLLRYAYSHPDPDQEGGTGVLFASPDGPLVRSTRSPVLTEESATPQSLEVGEERIVLRYPRGAALRAERTATGWEVEHENPENRPGWRRMHWGAVDPSYRATRFGSWRGDLSAVLEARRLTYRLPPDEPSKRTAPSGSLLCLPHLFATELWEGPGAAFSDMKPGDMRDADYLSLRTNDKATVPVRIERRPDPPPPSGATVAPARHYRLTSRTTAPGSAAMPSADVYTDGRRLIALVADDGSRIVREGWEAWAARRDAAVAVKATGWQW